MKPDIKISSINVNGTLSNNRPIIAKAFNNYFISVAQNILVDNLNNENISFNNNNNKKKKKKKRRRRRRRIPHLTYLLHLINHFLILIFLCFN